MDHDTTHAHGQHSHRRGSDDPLTKPPHLDVQHIVEGIEEPRARERRRIGQPGAGRRVQVNLHGTVVVLPGNHEHRLPL